MPGDATSLSGLLEALTDDELNEFRTQVIDASSLTRFPALFSRANAEQWVNCEDLQRWLIQKSSIGNKLSKRERENSVDSVVEVISVSHSPSKRAKTEYIECDAPEPIEISSGSDSDDFDNQPAQSDVKLEENQISVTRQLAVSRIISLSTFPRCWPIPKEEVIGYLLDLSNIELDWVEESGRLISMERMILKHDQDNWHSSGRRRDTGKCPKVEPLGGQAHRSIWQCQGCYTCSFIDPDLLNGCERWDFDEDQMQTVWDAELAVNKTQDSSSESITMNFFNVIQSSQCEDEGVICPGKPVLRQWRDKAKNLDGQRYFVGCSEWRKEDPPNIHRFIPLRFGVDEDLLLSLVQDFGKLGESKQSKACSLVRPRRVGAKMKHCPYPHIKNGIITFGKMTVRPCPAKIIVFTPVDSNVRKAFLVPQSVPHNHPVYPEHKLSLKAEKLYKESIETVGVLGSTVAKVDKAPSTKKLLGGLSPTKFHPGFASRRKKTELIQKSKAKVSPAGLGLAGVLQRREDQKTLPSEKQYIHRITDMAGIQLIVTMLPSLAMKMHDVSCSFHDNTYKRTVGKWKEWEVVIWDSRLNMRLTVARIYCDFESAQAFEFVWTAFFEVLEEVTGCPLQFKAFHKEGKYAAVLADGDAGQALGLGKYLQKINDPSISDIHETDPGVLVQYMLKTCWTHCAKNLKTLGQYISEEDYNYLMSLEDIKSEAEVAKFRQWCQTHSVKAVRDWYENKARHAWYLPSLNPFLSRIPQEDWISTPRNTNLGESAHAHTNFHTGTNLSLLAAIDAAYQYDLERDELIREADKNHILPIPQNTSFHRMKKNVVRAATRAKKVAQAKVDTQKAGELQELVRQIESERESRKQPSILTSFERKASIERSKLLQTQIDQLRREGVSLKRGRKAKPITPKPVSQSIEDDNTNPTQMLHTQSHPTLPAMPLPTATLPPAALPASVAAPFQDTGIFTDQALGPSPVYLPTMPAPTMPAPTLPLPPIAYHPNMAVNPQSHFAAQAYSTFDPSSSNYSRDAAPTVASYNDALDAHDVFSPGYTQTMVDSSISSGGEFSADVSAGSFYRTHNDTTVDQWASYYTV